MAKLSERISRDGGKIEVFDDTPRPCGIRIRITGSDGKPRSFADLLEGAMGKKEDKSE